MKKILIIIDDVDVCKQILYAVQGKSIQAYYAASVSDAILKVAEEKYSLIILDLVQSEIDGMKLLTTLRSLHHAPILVLSGDGRLEKKVAAFQNGADDFVTKPLVLEEILLRVQALMRRFEGASQYFDHNCTVFVCQDIIINREQRKVIFRGNEVKLTRKEFDILYLLIANQEMVYTFEQIYEQVWHEEYYYDKNRVICHIKGLRQKLDSAPFIESVYGVGYRFRVDKV